MACWNGIGRASWAESSGVIARFGVLGLPFPEEYDRSAADILTTMLMMEGLGYGTRDSGLLFAMNAQMWSVQMPILNFGTAAQKEKTFLA